MAEKSSSDKSFDSVYLGMKEDWDRIHNGGNVCILMPDEVIIQKKKIEAIIYLLHKIVKEDSGEYARVSIALAGLIK